MRIVRELDRWSHHHHAEPSHTFTPPQLPISTLVVLREDPEFGMIGAILYHSTIRSPVFQVNTQHILIAGGSRGIGLGCADLLLKRGHAVSVLSRTKPEAGPV